MGNTLRDNTVLVIGRGSGIARAVALLAQSEGARVIVAGRDQTKLASAYSRRDIRQKCAITAGKARRGRGADLLGRAAQ